MRPRRHLVIFARRPALGRVKRRLGGDIGAVAATRFHRLCLDAAVRRLSGDRRWRTWLALTPDRSVPSRMAPERIIAQGAGDLGDRMARTLRRFAPAPVIIVGSDIPGVRADDVARAFRSLAARLLVLGPAPDGGYWLIGWSGRRPLPRGALQDVRWSSDETLADTLRSFGADESAILPDPLEDVDNGDAYARWWPKLHQHRRR